MPVRMYWYGDYGNEAAIPIENCSVLTTADKP